MKKKILRGLAFLLVSPIIVPLMLVIAIPFTIMALIEYAFTGNWNWGPDGGGD